MPFFLEFTQISIDWSVRTSLYVSTELFSGEANSLIKNIFQIVFHNLGGKFSGFLQNFSSTVVRTAYVPRFFNRTYANFSRTLRFIGWSVRTYVSTGLFSKHLLWKKHFSKCFSEFRRIQNFSSMVVQTALVTRFFNRIYANFFLDSTQISLNWSVRTALYVSTELFLVEATSLIKNLFQLVFHNLGGNFSGLWQNFSSTVVRTAYFFEKNTQNFMGKSVKLHSLCPHDCFTFLWKKKLFQM